MPNTLTEQFIDCIHTIDFDTLPGEAVEMAKHVTLDGLAVMLAGATEPLGVGRISIDYVKAMGGAPQASVIAGGFKTSLTNAAYANGGRTSLGGVEKDDYQHNSRYGVTLAVPLSQAWSAKLAWSKGFVTRAGGDYEIAAVALQYRWFDR